MQRLYGTVSLWCFGPSLEAKRQNSDLHGEWSVRVPCVSSCLAPFLSCLSRRLMDGGGVSGAVAMALLLVDWQTGGGVGPAPSYWLLK